MLFIIKFLVQVPFFFTTFYPLVSSLLNIVHAILKIMDFSLEFKD